MEEVFLVVILQNENARETRECSPRGFPLPRAHSLMPPMCYPQLTITKFIYSMKGRSRRILFGALSLGLVILGNNLTPAFGNLEEASNVTDTYR
jgi:hypothetical protein